LRLKILKKLRTASLNSEFTSSYKKKCIHNCVISIFQIITTVQNCLSQDLKPQKMLLRLVLRPRPVLRTTSLSYTYLWVGVYCLCYAVFAKCITMFLSLCLLCMLCLQNALQCSWVCYKNAINFVTLQFVWCF